MNLNNKTKAELIKEINALKKQVQKLAHPIVVKKQSSPGVIKKQVDIDPSVFENIPFCYVLYDEKKVYYLNKAVIDLFKLSKEQAKNIDKLSIYDFINKEDHKKIKKANKDILNGKQSIGIESNCFDCKGNKIIIESFAKPVYYKGKQVLQGFFRDISERKIIQQELIKSKDNFKSIISKIDEVVFYYNKVENRIEYISDQLIDLVGISAADYIKNPKLTIDLAHPDDLAKLYEANKKLNKYKTPQSFTYRILHKKKKQYIWIEEKIFPQFNDKKEHIANLGISRDITNSISNNEKQNEAVEKYKLLADNASDVIFSYYFLPHPHYSYISPSMEKITGYPLKKFYEDPYFGFKIVHPEDQKKLSVEQTKKTLEEKKNEFEDINKPQIVRFITKTGKIIWLETRYTQIKKNGITIGQEGISRDITAQKEAEIELAKKENTLKNLFNNLPGMAYRCLNDKYWTMQFLSDGCYELTGYKSKDLLENKSKSFSDLVHPEDKYLGKDDVYFAIKNKTAFEIEYRIISKYKKEIWVWEKGEGVYDEKGKLLYIEGFITDISERKKAENELNQKWLNYKNVIDKMPVGVFIHENGRILFGNDLAFRVSGIDKNDKLAQINILDFLDDEYKEIAINRIKLATSGKDDLPQMVYPITNKKGEKFVVNISSSPVIFNGKNAVQIIIQDITKEFLLEKEKERALVAETTNIKLQEEIENRIKTEEELNKTKNYLQSIIDSSLDMITASDKNGYIIEFNKAALEKFGYSAKEMIGKSADVMFSSKTNQKEAIAKLFSKGYFKGEVINKTKDGKEFISYLSASVLKNEKGDVIGTMGVSRDITEAKKQEELIRQNQEALLQQSSRLKAIFENSSHLVWTVNKAYEVGFFNTNFANVVFSKYGITVKQNQKLEDSIKDAKQKKDYMAYWQPLYAQVFKGEALKLERVEKDNNGNETNRLIYLNPIFKNGEVVEISCLANDITDIRKYEKQIIEQTSKLKAIFENGEQLFWSVNTKQELVTFNSKYSNAIHTQYGFYPELGKKLSNIKPSNSTLANYYIEFWDAKYDEVISTKKPITFVTERVLGDDKKIYRQVYLYPIFNNQLTIVEVGGMAIDITELKYYQEKTVDQAAKLNAIIENSHHQIWSMNTNFELTSFNKNYEKFIENIFGINPKIGDCMVKEPFVTTKEKNNEISKHLEKVAKGENVEFIYSVKDKEGKTVWRETFLSPIYDKQGKLVEISGIANDITLRKQIEEEKNRQTALIKAIFESSSHLIYTINKDLTLTSFNKNYFESIKESYGYETYIGKKIGEGSLSKNAPKEYINWVKLHQEAIKGKSGFYTSSVVKPTGEITYYETFLDPVYLPSGGVEEVSYITFNITDKYLSEEKLKTSLKEKEVLLKEVHHRVKNNLQVISSILNLQSTYVKDDNTLYILRECQNRIKSMAFIHEALYQNKQFAEIPFDEYLIMLVKNLFHSYSIDHAHVRLNFDVERVFLNIDTSIPCGLIVNELVSNAFKYAFPGKKQGFIFISLKKQNDDVTLIIKDNGIGLANEIDFRNTESLGLQLVVTLVEQIGGQIKLDSSNGTKFEITFKQITDKNV
jgi:PAS domain S-box-containing protein